MSSTIGEFKHESAQDKNSIIKYLKALIEGIEKSHLNFRNKNEELIMEPKGLLNLEIRAKKTESKSKIMIKVSWKDKNPKVDSGPLEINS